MLNMPTLEERMDDVRAVMDHAGVQRASLFGRLAFEDRGAHALKGIDESWQLYLAQNGV
jgi:hypothetical protein